MARKYIFQHRRGTTDQWKSATSKLLEGEIGIEYSNDRTSARLLIGNADGMDALPFSAVIKIITLSLPASNWTGTLSPFSQVFEAGTLNGVTKKSKIDLQPTTDLLTYLQDAEISLVATNDNGIVTVYAVGYKPDIDITIQATITEVNME